MSKLHGFTLLEISVVVGAGALMLALVLPSYSSIRKDVAVGGYADQIVSALQTVQNRAITSQGGLTWGVHFTSTSYVLYSGSWSAPSNQVSYTIGNGVQFTVSPSNSCEIVFSHLTGQKDAATTCTSSVVVGVGSIQKTITVGSTGQVSVQ